jgi:hypothetical protein
MLVQSQLNESGVNSDLFHNETAQSNFDLQNIKDDIILIQFKLVKKQNMRTHNVQTFINVPSSKIHDVNLQTLIEIVQKQNQRNAKAPGSNLPPLNKNVPSLAKTKVNRKNAAADVEKQFLPYNKSILTRILY